MRREAVLLAALLAGACHHHEAEELDTEAAPAVKVATARRGPIAGVISATGTVDPAPGADWTITAPGPARVGEITKAEGDRVRKGEVLVRFDAPTLRAEAASRVSELQQARASLENARKNQARLSLLLSKGIASKKEVEDANKDLADAQAALRGARSASANAAELSGQAVVRARFDGVVVKRSHNPGDQVDGGAGDPVLRVIDPSRLQVTAGVAVAALARIRIGQPARLRVAGAPPESSWAGTVASLPAAVDPSTGTAAVRLSTTGTAPAGVPVEVEIIAERHDEAVVVPAAAVQREDEGAFVFVVGADRKAHKRRVAVGLEAPAEVEITRGVREGEQVVVEGGEDLPDGATVAIAR